jgi:hypothetical protein
MVRVWGLFEGWVLEGKFGNSEGRTADPSASLGMTKGTVELPFRFDIGDGEQQVPPLRFAPVGMTKGRVALPFSFDIGDEGQQVPPLRFAPVGMTLLFIL